MDIHAKIICVKRREQPISELKRKANKARRRGFFTQEDRDLACAEAVQIMADIGWQS